MQTSRSVRNGRSSSVNAPNRHRSRRMEDRHRSAAPMRRIVSVYPGMRRINRRSRDKRVRKTARHAVVREDVRHRQPAAADSRGRRRARARKRRRSRFVRRRKCTRALLPGARIILHAVVPVRRAERMRLRKWFVLFPRRRNRMIEDKEKKPFDTLCVERLFYVSYSMRRFAHALHA